MKLLCTFLHAQLAYSLLFVAVILSAVFLGHFLTLGVIKLVPESASKGDPIGKWIGYLERALIATFVFLGLIKETVFIFAIKSAIISFRLPKEGDAEWRLRKGIAEHMLVGTMASYFWALIIALIGHSFWAFYTRG